MAHPFETALVRCFNEYFELKEINALAYRNKQYRFTEQLFDVFVDSGRREFYIAIEAKSIDVSTCRRLYYTKYFHQSSGEHQIVRESNHLKITGRGGVLAIEARRGRGKHTACFFVPWGVLYHSYSVGEPGLLPEQITYSPSLTKQKGKYEMNDTVMGQIIDGFDHIARAGVGDKWKRKIKA